MGHMNVRFYLAKAHQGMQHLATLLGLGPEALKDAGLRLDLKAQHIRYLRELHAGADLTIEGGVVKAEGTKLTFFQEVLPLTGEPVSATMTSELVLRDLATGEARDLPDGVLQKAKALSSDVPDYGAPRTLQIDQDIPVRTEAEALERRHITIAQEVVRGAQVDQDGYLYPDEFIGFVSNGLGHLFGDITSHLPERYQRTEDIGGAALEYRFDIVRLPRCGEGIKVLSAPAEIFEKVYMLRHILVSPERGDVLARAESVHIAFNLKTRKSILVPDHLRAGMEAFLGV